MRYARISGAVGRHPPEHLAGKGFLLGLRPKEDIGFQACLGQQLRERGRVAERVHVAPDGRNRPEAVAQETLRVQGLADEGFPVWEVAIRFDPPAAHDDETALFYVSSDPGKQLRVDAFDPLQVGDGIGGEHEVVVLVHPLERELKVAWTSCRPSCHCHSQTGSMWALPTM